MPSKRRRFLVAIFDVPLQLSRGKYYDIGTDGDLPNLIRYTVRLILLYGLDRTRVQNNVNKIQSDRSFSAINDKNKNDEYDDYDSDDDDCDDEEEHNNNVVRPS